MDQAEHEAFLEGLETCGRGAWKKIAAKYVRTNRDAGRVARAEALHAHRETNSNKYRLRQYFRSSQVRVTQFFRVDHGSRRRRVFARASRRNAANGFKFDDHVQVVVRPTGTPTDARRPQVGWLPDLM